MVEVNSYKGESELIERLRRDENLRKDQQRLDAYLNTARIFLKDVAENINKNAFELNEATGINFEDWHEFLQNPTVAAYKEELILGMARAKFGKDLIDSDSDGKRSVDSYQKLRNLGGINDRSKFIYSRLPTRREEELVERPFVRELEEYDD